MINLMPLVLENDDGIRPAGFPDECFYCKQKVGQHHKEDCVVVTKEVIIEYTIKIPTRVPHFWDREQIEFHRNEGSWCSSNMLKDLEAFDEKENGCLCSHIEAKYIETTDPEPKIPEND